MRWLTVFGIMVSLGAAPATSCTIFKITQSEETLVGNSEDWLDENAKVWFLAPVPGKHGRVLFGFDNGWAQGGMNDQGLFFDGIAGEAKDWKPVAHREDFPGNLCEKIIEEATTVDDAVLYFKRYNFPSLVVGAFVFVDATGRTAVISYAGGRLKIDILSTSTFAKGYRGENARTLLNDMPSLDVQAMAQILKSCQRRDKYATQYGNVYDPLRLEVHVYPSQGVLRDVTFDLERELRKGDHYYDLASLSEQMGMGLIVDHKTRPTWNCPFSSLKEYIGQYDLDKTSFMITRSGDSLMLRSAIILDAVMSFEIQPVAKDEFYVRHLAIEVKFHRDRYAKIDSLTLVYDGRVFACRGPLRSELD